MWWLFWPILFCSVCGSRGRCNCRRRHDRCRCEDRCHRRCHCHNRCRRNSWNDWDDNY